MSETQQPRYPKIDVSSKHSLIHIGSLDSFDVTEGGKAAARCLLDYFTDKDHHLLLRAVEIYDEIIPNENFGGEYTALQWICRLLLAPEEGRADFLAHPEVLCWYEYLANDNYAMLREYITYKYHFSEVTADDAKTRKNLRFLEDFILFSNPDRNRWENTLENLYRFGVRPGCTVADVGAGPGYFSFKFADIVGDSGKVYAIETNPMHIDYLNAFIQRFDRKNVEVIKCHTEGIGLAPEVKADIVFTCSLYHVLYAAFTEAERVSYIGSIVNALKPEGRLIVVDNGLVTDGDMPYHGPYISKDLIVAQLWHYGFTLRDSFDFTVQRYALAFEYTGVPSTDDLVEDETGDDNIAVKSRASLVNYRIADAAPTAGYTKGGQKAAEAFVDALETMDPAKIQKALEVYQELIPTERIGDEYSAFEWFCKYLLADEDVRAAMIADGLTKSFFDFLAADDFTMLKKYLKTKYELVLSDGSTILDGAERGNDETILPTDLGTISEYIAFNNPNRNSWEQTEKMLAYLDLQPGQRVADIGCGSGYFTYRFAQAVGETGVVYATEINKGALSYVEDMKTRFGMPIEPVVARLNDACLPENSFDTIFMCSMYHAVYIASIEYVKDAFIESVKKALKDDGRLFLVDNEINKPGVVSYYGSSICRDLTIAQLRHYGFVLVDTQQFIPQRYILVFKKG
jgi:predicted methyltransferase